MTRGLLDWWDAVELWLTQLEFPAQVGLAIVVLLPGCWLAAAAIDRGVDLLLGALAARRAAARPEATAGTSTGKPTGPES